MRTRTQSWIAGIGAAIFIAAAGACQAHGAGSANGDEVDDNDIVIGQSTDLSGKNAHVSRQFLSGANVYFEQLNANGGVHGRHIRLITIDDKGDTELAVKNTQQLVLSNQAVALFGYVGAQNSSAVLPLVNEHKVPYFAPVTGSRIVYGAFNRHVFTIRASYINEYDYLFSRLSQMGLRRMAIFNDAAGLSYDSLMQTMIADAKAQMVTSENSVGRDLDKIVDSLIQARPDIILIMSISQQMNSNLIKSLRAKGYLGYFYCASLVCSPLLTNDLQEAANGLIMSQIVPFPWKAGTPIVHEYQKALRKAGIKKFSYLSLEGYIAAKVLAEGLNRAGQKITREKLIAALESMNDKNYPNAGYQINFSATNHRGSTYVDMTTVGKEGTFVP